MRERLYIETLQTVMNASSKVMVDVAGGNNMLYLPLERMGGTPSYQNVRARGNTDVSDVTIRKITEQLSQVVVYSSTDRPGCCVVMVCLLTECMTLLQWVL